MIITGLMVWSRDRMPLDKYFKEVRKAIIGIAVAPIPNRLAFFHRFKSLGNLLFLKSTYKTIYPRDASENLSDANTTGVNWAMLKRDITMLEPKIRPSVIT